MTPANRERRRFLGGLVCTGSMLAAHVALGQESRDQLREPLYRVAQNDAQAPAAAAGHPLDKPLELAHKALEIIRNDIKDYTCTVVKRERVRGVLHDHEYMFAKIRNGKMVDGRTSVNFSAYLYFLKPEAVKGREVIYIDNENNGKMIVKEGGIKGKLLPSVWLKPDSALAMADNLHPITDLGLENLVLKLIDRAERERQVEGECDVQFMKNAKINGRTCTLLQLKHPVKRPQFDFHLAQVFIDDELQIPIRYAAYGWPEKEGEQPSLLEEYTYLNLKLNPGLTDADFDHNNPNYKFH